MSDTHARGKRGIQNNTKSRKKRDQNYTANERINATVPHIPRFLESSKPLGQPQLKVFQLLINRIGVELALEATHPPILFFLILLARQ
jgi:hypothetical protein